MLLRPNQRVIAFTGPKTCGKDAAASFILRRPRTEKIAYAAAVKDVCTRMFDFSHARMHDASWKEAPMEEWPFECSRFHMQKVAKMFRQHYGPDVWVKIWERAAALSLADTIVVTDLRHVEELDSLHALKADIVYIHRDVAERELLLAQQRGDRLALDPSEASYAAMRKASNYTIYNNHSLDVLEEAVEEVWSRTYES